GALGVMTETMKTYGPDSFIGYLVCLLNAGTDTTFYVMALYFGSVHVRVVRQTLAACLAADLAGFTVATALCHVFFGSAPRWDGAPAAALTERPFHRSEGPVGRVHLEPVTRSGDHLQLHRGRQSGEAGLRLGVHHARGTADDEGDALRRSCGVHHVPV